VIDRPASSSEARRARTSTDHVSALSSNPVADGRICAVTPLDGPARFCPMAEADRGRQARGADSVPL